MLYIIKLLNKGVDSKPQQSSLRLHLYPIIDGLITTLLSRSCIILYQLDSKLPERRGQIYIIQHRIFQLLYS